MAISPAAIDVTLAPGESADLEFQIYDLSPGSYTVSCDGLSAMLRVTGGEVATGNTGLLAAGLLLMYLLGKK